MNSRERILLVDDEPKMHTLLRVCLAPLGYDIESAASGPQALALLKASHYSVTTLDLMMPTMNGLEVLRDGRQNDDGRKIQIPTSLVCKGRKPETKKARHPASLSLNNLFFQLFNNGLIQPFDFTRPWCTLAV